MAEKLSNGMRQSIAISRALISDPNILIMDEPTAPLDNQSEEKLVKGLDLATKGKTCVFVTHRGAMLSLADKIVVMSSSQMVMFGPREGAEQIEGRGKMNNDKFTWNHPENT